MLVLSRKTTESIRIGENIEVRVLEISGGRVRLGIAAPLEVPVHRGEVAARLAEFQTAPDASATCKPVVVGTESAGLSTCVADIRPRRRAR